MQITKFTLGILMAGLAMTAWAVPQIADDKGTPFTANAGGWFDIQANGSLAVTYYAPASSFGQVNQFGYTVLDDKGQVMSRTALNVAPHETVSIDGLKRGDRIGFFLTSKKGELLSTAGSKYFYETLAHTQDYWTLGSTSWNRNAVVAFTTGYTEDAPVAGQPLPGVAVTLLLGGAASWYTTRRNRRRS